MVVPYHTVWIASDTSLLPYHTVAHLQLGWSCVSMTFFSHAIEFALGLLFRSNSSHNGGESLAKEIVIDPVKEEKPSHAHPHTFVFPISIVSLQSHKSVGTARRAIAVLASQSRHLHMNNNNNNNNFGAAAAALPRTGSAVALCASCDRCRARKTKCDGQRPCGNCATKYLKKHKLTR